MNNNKLWFKTFPEQIGFINYNKESNILQIGLDSGRIIIYKIDEENDYSNYKEICNIKPHKDKVMDIGFNNNGDLYTLVQLIKCFY